VKGGEQEELLHDLQASNPWLMPAAADCCAVACLLRLDKDNKPGKYYDTGEDQHGVVARRYGGWLRLAERAVSTSWASTHLQTMHTGCNLQHRHKHSCKVVVHPGLGP